VTYPDEHDGHVQRRVFWQGRHDGYFISSVRDWMIFFDYINVTIFILLQSSNKTHFSWILLFSFPNILTTLKTENTTDSNCLDRQQLLIDLSRCSLSTVTYELWTVPACFTMTVRWYEASITSLSWSDILVSTFFHCWCSRNWSFFCCWPRLVSLNKMSDRKNIYVALWLM